MVGLRTFKQGEDAKISIQLQRDNGGTITPVPVGPIGANIVMDIKAIATIAGQEVARFSLNQAQGYLGLEIDTNDDATVILLFSADETKGFPVGQMHIAVKPVFVDTSYPNGRREEFGGNIVLVVKGEAAQLI